MNSRKIAMVLAVTGIILTFIGGTFAFWIWTSNSVEATNVVFTVEKAFACSADGGGNIIAGDKKLAPSTCTNTTYAVQREIKVNATHTDNQTVYLDMWLNVNSIGAPLAQSRNLKYVLTTSSAGCTAGSVVAEGNFQGATVGSHIRLLTDKAYPTNTTNDTYYLYIWLDEAETNINTMGQTFDVSLGGECVNQPLTRPNAPVLDDGMIPVTIANDGTVTSVSENNPNWYDYSNQRWANAVLVKEGNRNSYKTAGTPIPETDILAYFVWIPRYAYKLFYTGTAAQTNKQQSITIKFSSGTATESGSTVGEYLTHPAFTFGSEELPGIWVGKFETTGNGTTPTIKKNTSSLRGQNVYQQFQTALKFSGGSIVSNTASIGGSSYYGLSSNSDTHMAKNSEWGAVAYLSHSKYGVNTEIRINNNSGYTTGCGASVSNASSSASCEIAYGNGNPSYPQSTTGNISGIFDMSGGAWEYVMGRRSTATTDDSPEFYNASNEKYYRNDYSSLADCANGACLGEALNETSGWYNDYASFVSPSGPWFLRGGYCDSGARAGAFYFDYATGGGGGYLSFRVVLVARRA